MGPIFLLNAADAFTPNVHRCFRSEFGTSLTTGVRPLVENVTHVTESQTQQDKITKKPIFFDHLFLLGCVLYFVARKQNRFFLFYI